MMILSFIASNASKIWGVVSSFLLGFLVKKNAELKRDIKTKDVIIDIQQEQIKIHDEANSKPVTLKRNTNRMRKGEL